MRSIGLAQHHLHHPIGGTVPHSGFISVQASPQSRTSHHRQFAANVYHEQLGIVNVGVTGQKKKIGVKEKRDTKGITQDVHQLQPPNFSHLNSNFIDQSHMQYIIQNYGPKEAQTISNVITHTGTNNGTRNNFGAQVLLKSPSKASVAAGNTNPEASEDLTQDHPISARHLEGSARREEKE